MDSVMPWRVRTFGGFSAERNGVRHDRFRTQHAAALLAFLALKPDVRHSREVLAEHLWPEADPLVARQRLSSALANLRRVLEADGTAVFTGGRDSVGVHPGMLTSDAAEFNRLLRQAKGASQERRRERLREARELAGDGEFLPGFYFEWTVERSSHFAEALDAIRAELDTVESGTLLPAEDPSSLVGRTAEIEILDRMLTEHARWISILGAGGVGKTRLALDLFERHARRFPGASVFVRLAEVRHPRDFLPALSNALRLPGGEIESLPDAIAGALAIPGLVVLDNLEHLLPGIHPQLDALMRSCGRTTFVGTSRRSPGLAGERILRVRPLRSTSPQDLTEAPAIRLFLARYAEAGGSPLPPESLAAIEEVCDALGGLPLAIQLAASAAVAVGLEALRTNPKLQGLLPSRNPDATNPHASLGEMIEWSLMLLDRPTREVLDALCILPGSFDLGIVRDLYGEEAVAALPRLHGDSLLESDGQGTMRVLEPIRDHIRARTPEEDRVRLEIRLVHRCAELADAFEARFEGPDQRSATEEAATFWPTMRLAVQFAAERCQPNEGLRILTGLMRSLYIAMRPADAIALAEPLLAKPGIEPRIHAQAHAALAQINLGLGRSDASYSHATAGIEIARLVGDLRTEARCTFCLAYVAVIREDQPKALAIADHAVELGRQSGDRVSQGWAQLIRAHAHALYRKDASAEEIHRSRCATAACLEAAAAVAREANDDLMESTIQYHGSIYAETDIDLYRARLTRAIAINRRNGWSLREALARSALVFRLYTGGQVENVLEEVRSLQRLYAECGRWDIRAEQVAFEAEVLYRMDRLPEAQAAIEDAKGALQSSGRYHVVEDHVQALIYGALGHPEADVPLLVLIEKGGRNEFSAMLAELARALLEARRGEHEAAYRRLLRFEPDSKPTRVRHAFADTLVAFADAVAPRNLRLSVSAYRNARRIYREVRSTMDLQRVRGRVSNLAKSRRLP